jgi:thiol-disulfide isomerase/thioredoxin
MKHTSNNSELRILFFISDWCPNCIEYKVTINQLKCNTDIPFRVLCSEEIKLEAIPATLFFKKNKIISFFYGYRTYEELYNYYKNINERNRIRRKTAGYLISRE